MEKNPGGGTDFLLSPGGAEFLAREVISNPLKYVSDLDRQVTHRQLLAGITQRMYNVDKITGVSMTYGAGRTFYCGAVLGMVVAEQFLPGSLTPHLGMAMVPYRHRASQQLDQGAVEYHNLREALTLGEVSDLGWDAAEPYYQELFDVVDPYFTPLETARPFARKGFGFVVYAVDTVWNAHVQAKIDATEEDIDLDTELEVEFGEPF